MNIKEAFQKFKRLELQDFGKKRKFEHKESEVAYITVSNELDKYRDRIYELINEVTIKDAEIEKKDKVIDMMAEYIEEWIGSCPNDMYDWQEIDCDKECEISMKKCWIEYFYKLVEGNIDKK